MPIYHSGKKRFSFVYRLLSPLLILLLVFQGYLPHVVPAQETPSDETLPQWVQLQPQAPLPPEQHDSHAGYNPSSNRLISFTGQTNISGNAVPSDVWVLTNANGLEANPPTWINVVPENAPGSPPKRASTATAYDDKNNRLILFGGAVEPTLNQFVNDVWVLSNADGASGTPQWTQLNIAGDAPIPRILHSPNQTNYDSVTNRLILFGGEVKGGPGFIELNDVWVLTNANGLGGVPAWTQLTPSGTPPQLTTHADPFVTYDPGTNRLIVFFPTGAQGQNSSEVWVLTNANGLGGTPEWVRLPITTLLPPRYGSSGIYDPQSNQLLLYSGFTSLNNIATLHDLWVLKNANGLGGQPVWTQVHPVEDINGRVFSRAAYDAVNNRMIIFAGLPANNGGIFLNDTWVLENAITDRTPPTNDFSLSTDHGGNTGSVTVTVFGTGFIAGDTLKLTAPGQVDILGSNDLVSSSGATLTSTFDLSGKTPGQYSVVIIHPDSTTITVSQPFTIEQGGAADVWVDLVGFDKIRAGRPQLSFLVYGNRGNIDADYHIILTEFPKFLGWVTPIHVPLFSNETDKNTTIVAFDTYRIPPGSFVTIPIQFTLPEDPQFAHMIFDIELWYEHPNDLPEIVEEEVNNSPALAISNNVNNIAAMTVVDMCTSSFKENQCGPEICFSPDPNENTVRVLLRGNDICVNKCACALSNLQCLISRNPLGVSPIDPKCLNCTNVGGLRPEAINALIALRYSLNCPLEITGGSELDSHTIGFNSHPAGLKVDINPSKCVADAICKNENIHRTCDRHDCKAKKKNKNGSCIDPNRNTHQYEDALGNIFAAEIRESGNHWDVTLNASIANVCPLRIVKLKEGITASDPNDKVGTTGVGTHQYILGDTPLRYAIQYENKPNASAAAQTVVVTDQLDIVNEDLSTFTLGPISVANQLVTPPPGTGDFSTTLDLRPDNNLLLVIKTHLDTTTGLLTWTFQSLDPATNLPPEDPEAGFLPPGAGGSMFFTVMPKENLAADTEIKNFASIVFDVNAPIDTPTWLNTIDNTAPVSHVLALPREENANTFTVEWTAADQGSGVQDYSIFVSDNGGDFIPFVTDTPLSSSLFTGESGHTYAFYSLSRDLTGNREKKSPVAEAETLVQADSIPPVTTAALSPLSNASGWNNSDVTVQLNSVDNPGGSGVNQLTYSAAGAQLIPAAVVNGDAASLMITNEGETVLKFYAMDNAVNLENEKSQTIKLDKTFVEAYNQFDPASKDVVLFGRDALAGTAPGPITPVSVMSPRQLKDDEDGDEDDDVDMPEMREIKEEIKRKSGIFSAELRTYRILDSAGNELELVEEVKRTGHHVTVKIISLKYGDGLVINLPSNRQSYTWISTKTGDLKLLSQVFSVGFGKDRQFVNALYNGRTNRTTIHQRARKIETRPGLTLLHMLTAKGKLVIEF